MLDYENYEARKYERIASIEESDEENGDMTQLEELGAKADEVFRQQGKDYSDSDFGLDEEEDLEDEEGYDFDDEEEEEDDEPQDARPGSDKVLSFEDIVDAEDLDEDRLWIEKWGGNVVIRSITKREFDQMRRNARRKDSRGRVNEILERELIIAGVVSPRLNVATYERLQEKSPGPFVTILNAIYKKSGLEKEAEKDRERRFPSQR